jgi:hypothetical protein
LANKRSIDWIDLIDTFGPNQSGKFYNYDDREYPW